MNGENPTGLCFNLISAMWQIIKNNQRFQLKIKLINIWQPSERIISNTIIITSWKQNILFLADIKKNNTLWQQNKRFPANAIIGKIFKQNKRIICVDL